MLLNAKVKQTELGSVQPYENYVNSQQSYTLFVINKIKINYIHINTIYDFLAANAIFSYSQ